jgi:hypothetical protein
VTNELGVRLNGPSRKAFGHLVGWFSLTIGLAIAGCSVAAPSAGPSDSAFQAVATPTAVPGEIPSCRPGNVEVGAVWWAGATDMVQGGFTIFNTGKAACSIGTVADVRILDSAGHTLPIEGMPSPSGVGDRVLLLPGLGRPTLQDPPIAGRASGEIVWTNWCGDALEGLSITVSLPDVGSLSAPAGSPTPPRCDDSNNPSVLSVAPIGPKLATGG